MTSSIEEIKRQLQQLAVDLGRQRDELLDAWRASVQQDSRLEDVSLWPRSRFRNHIPFVLDAFQDKLQSWPSGDEQQQLAQQREAADAHSRHRWQQGYELRSLVREWGHLNQCVVRALHDYALHDDVAQQSKSETELDATTLREAQDLWAQLLNECVSENVVEYYRLLQTEAATRALELEQTLEHVRALEEERGHILRSAAHDLKGNLSVVMGSASMMDEQHLAKLSPSQRAELHRLFQQGFGSLDAMLSDLMSMARLEAGQEERNVAPFDASPLFTVMCANLQSAAQDRGLYLHYQGPATLPVEGDAVNVQRIAQNLLLNSLKYTQQGGVTLTWGQSEHTDEMWELCVEDTGPGLEKGTAAPLAQSLQDATSSARHVDGETLPAPQNQSENQTPENQTPRRLATTAGEGVGLAIVKRLCELLNASIDLQTSSHAGSTFRIVFPKRYEN